MTGVSREMEGFEGAGFVRYFDANMPAQQGFTFFEKESREV